MNDDREIEVYMSDEKMIIKEAVLKQIILHSIIVGVIASCELEGEVFSEKEKDALFQYRPASDILNQLLKTK